MLESVLAEYSSRKLFPPVGTLPSTRSLKAKATAAECTEEKAKLKGADLVQRDFGAKEEFMLVCGSSLPN